MHGLALTLALLAQATIVLDGNPQSTIVLTRDASDSQKTAARQLQDYIRQASGAELPITMDTGPQRNIFITTAPDPSRDPASFRIAVDDKTVRLTGASET